MMNVWRGAVWAVSMAGSGALAGAQSSASQPNIPAAYEPPAGMCRVWLRDVPPMQQPAPTDCRAALRTKPVGAVVIYGPEPKRSSFTPNDWSRRDNPRPARDDDHTRTPFRSGSDVCGDVNRDGLCDEAQGGEACVDTRNSARCDDAAPPMPAMRSAVLWIEGQRPADLQRWFGGLNVAARFVTAARGAVPERVQWFDGDGHLIQVWSDRNNDGRADRVEIFNHDGARIRVIGQP